jgi:hypothetical protein
MKSTKVVRKFNSVENIKRIANRIGNKEKSYCKSILCIFLYIWLLDITVNWWLLHDEIWAIRDILSVCIFVSSIFWVYKRSSKIDSPFTDMHVLKRVIKNIRIKKYFAGNVSAKQPQFINLICLRSVYFRLINLELNSFITREILWAYLAEDRIKIYAVYLICLAQK